MNRPARPIPLPWTVRLQSGPTNREPSQRPATPFSALRPGIAARWKPRDRVNAGGN